MFDNMRYLRFLKTFPSGSWWCMRNVVPLTVVVKYRLGFGTWKTRWTHNSCRGTDRLCRCSFVKHLSVGAPTLQ